MSSSARRPAGHQAAMRLMQLTQRQGRLRQRAAICEHFSTCKPSVASFETGKGNFLRNEENLWRGSTSAAVAAAAVALPQCLAAAAAAAEGAAGAALPVCHVQRSGRSFSGSFLCSFPAHSAASLPKVADRAGRLEERWDMDRWQRMIGSVPWRQREEGLRPGLAEEGSVGGGKGEEGGEEEGKEGDDGEGASLAIDVSELKREEAHSHEDPNDSAMVRHLKALIRFRSGPITVAEFMSEALTNPSFGFYMKRDVFGTHGDFVTSPDISQVFGELLGVWAMCCWEQLGQPKKLRIVELGPGRGTLMSDVLRGTSTFSSFSSALEVHLVEVSPALRRLQWEALKCQPKELSASGASAAGSGSSGADADVSSGRSDISGAQVFWHASLDQVPRGVPTLIFAHEFFDALPIHQFQKTPRGWCEKLVDVSHDADATRPFRFVLSPGPTSATALCLLPRLKLAEKDEVEVARIEQVQQVEVCPQAIRISLEIAERLNNDGGAALIVDYGQDGIVSDSLQAIKKHQFVHVFDDLGDADLSAHVDFAAMKSAIKLANIGATVHGPISQSELLGKLGIYFRVEKLLENANDEQAEALRLAYWRLVGDGEPPWIDGDDVSSHDGGAKSLVGMGLQYKAIAICGKGLGSPPICFESS